MKQFLAVLALMVSVIYAEEYPWSHTIPADIAVSALQPDQVLDEKPCDWRPVVTPIFAPIAKECKTAREAVLRIAANMGNSTGCYYSTERRIHNMNALEALAEKKISCTGQSILLVCALRSVDIPARAVGVHTWNHIEGNHTWVEAWIDGAWHMIEFNESDFNTPWVMENIGMLNTAHVFQRIYAANPMGNTTWWPEAFAKEKNLPNFSAEDVTERYMDLSRKWHSKHGLPEDSQRILIDLQPRADDAPTVEIVNESGRVVSAGKLPTSQDDMRYCTRLTVPRQGAHYLRIQGDEERSRIITTPAPVQLFRIRL